MTAIMAPAGLVPISAPLPAPRKYSLLDAAREVPRENQRWLLGQTSEGYVPGPASIFDQCSTGTDRVKADANEIVLTRFGAFTVYLMAECTAVAVAGDSGGWYDRLRLALQAVEAEAVERVFATGEGAADSFGPYLTDANLEVLDASGVSVVEGIGLLEDEIATKGGGGLIHVTPLLETYMVANNLVDTQGGQKITRGCGTRIVVGAGYIDAAATTTAGQTWAYATGPVEFSRGEIVPIPTNFSESHNRANNDVTWLAEREYVLNWVGRSDPSDDNHIQAGVLIDRAS
jgi:hypothetical protein